MHLGLRQGTEQDGRLPPIAAEGPGTSDAHAAVPGTVARRALVRRLETLSSPVRVVSVVAPSGYGKTTALRQWALASSASVSWVTVEPRDNDPGRLLRDVALAVHRIQPVEDATWAVLASRDPVAQRIGVRRLATTLHAAGRPVVVVVDGVHLLRRSAPLDLLLLLAESLRSPCRLVLAGQWRPRLRLGRLRSEGRCTELGAADLALSTAEATELLGQLGVRLRERPMREFMHRTEGWPAGVYLAALALRGAPDADAAVGAVSGETRDVADYFRDEVLRHHSPQTVRFLLRTSVLDRLSGPLCDAVLDLTGSAAWLSEIQALNLFVTPAPEGGGTLRYHRLFAETLRAELRRREPGEEAGLHRRAAAWFEAQGDVERALGHADRAGDPATVARLVSTHAFAALTLGVRTRRLAPWLESVEEGTLRRRPTTAVVAARVWLAVGDATRAQRALSVAASATYAGRLPDGSASLESAVLQLRAALAPDGVTRMLDDATRALELEPPGSTWHPLVSLLQGMAHWFTGSPEEAVEPLERAAHLAGAGQYPLRATALAELSLLAAHRRDRSAAAALATEAQRVLAAADGQDELAGMLTRAAAARVRLHAGDLHGTREQLRHAVRLYGEHSPISSAWFAAHSSHVLAEVLLGLGDNGAAARTVHEAARHLSVLSDTGTLGVDQDRLLRQLDETRRPAPGVDGSQLTPAETRILRLLPTHLSVSDIATELVISRNTVKTQVSAVYRKLGVVSRAEAVRVAQDRGLLD